jgi:hypothetical protein
MKTLFENQDFRLSTTGHYYDFVGIIETKTKEPLTFFFSEELCPVLDEGEEYDPEEMDYEWEPDESRTAMLGVYQGLKEYNSETDDPEDDEEQNTAEMYHMANADIDHVSSFRTRDDKSTGFLSDPRERGQFLAIIKAYCPDKLKEISWA